MSHFNFKFCPSSLFLSSLSHDNTLDTSSNLSNSGWNFSILWWFRIQRFFISKFPPSPLTPPPRKKEKKKKLLLCVKPDNHFHNKGKYKGIIVNEHNKSCNCKHGGNWSNNKGDLSKCNSMADFSAYIFIKKY